MTGAWPLLRSSMASPYLYSGPIAAVGPWPKNTPAVLAALAANCTKAIFFPIGLHATYHPEILKQVVTAVTRGALRDSAVSLLSPTQDHINDLRPPGERYK
jgi:peptidoglycan/xylan/chitin deacetylase (PgdA/CDA1 family)